jgi:hypothetical protein
VEGKKRRRGSRRDWEKKKKRIFGDYCVEKVI